MIVVVMVLNLIIIGLVLGAGREHELTVRRVDTIQAMYAAEAGMNMSIRERFTLIDEDADGAVGSISDDGDPGNDPAFGEALVSVQVSPDDPLAGQVTLTSTGRSGDSRRKMIIVLE